MNTKENILQYIDQIEQVSSYSEMSVVDAITSTYVKSLLIMENYDGNEIYNFPYFVQEGKILDKAIGKGKNENSLIKIIKFIPRLIGALIDAIKNAIKNLRRKRANKIADKIDIISDPERKELLENALKEIGCDGTISDGVVSVKHIKDLAVEFKDDVQFKVSDTGLMKVIFPYYKIDQLNEFNKDINIKIVDIKRMFNNKKYDKLVRSLKELDRLFKGIATNQSRITEKSFKDINAWDNYMKEVLETFNIFSDRLSSIKKMFDEMDSDINDMKTPLGSLVDDIRKLLTKTPNDIKLITELDKKIHEVYNVLTDAHADEIDKLFYDDFLYKIPDKSKLVNINKFDNHHIIEAIKKFNKFYKNDVIKNPGRDPNILAKQSEYFKDAINELNKQFNVRIRLDTGIKNRGMFTRPGMMNGDPTQKLTVSKTKGFDLGGIEILIGSEIYGDIINDMYQSGKMLFGQIMCSSICHEIFHNISYMMIYENVAPGKIQSAIVKLINNIFDVGMDIKSAVEHFLAKIGIKTAGMKYEERIRTLIKNVIYSSYDKSLFKRICDKIFNKQIDEISSKEIDGIREIPIDKIPMNVKKVISDVLMVGILLVFIVFGTVSDKIPTIIHLSAILILGLKLGSMIKPSDPELFIDNEESLADAFAAMYKLPVVFENRSKVAKLAKSGRERFNKSVNDNRGDPHSSTYDRTVIGYNTAKEILNSGEKIEPELREYLEYIVKEFKDIDKAERHYTKAQIKKSAPEFNSDINSAINDFIAKNNISVTESSLIDIV